MRKLSNLFMTLSVLCFALFAFAQGGGVRGTKCPDPGQAKVFTASRLKEDFWFPTRIVVSPLRVCRVKSSLFSNDVACVGIPKIASYRSVSHVLWAELLIESTGGEPLIIRGLFNADAKQITDLIARYQRDEGECRAMDRVLQGGQKTSFK
jgi:hypothetical protein